MKITRSLALLSLLALPAGAADPDPLRQSAASSGETKVSGGKKCKLSFVGQKLTLSGNVRSARIQYTIGDDCAVSASAAVFSTATVVAASAAPKRVKSKSKSEQWVKGQVRPAATYGCTVNVWEEDFPGIRMINMQNHTTWEADSRGISSGRVNGYAHSNLDWWWVNGDPVVDIGYVNAPHVGGSFAGANFFCDGSNFCRTCSTKGCGIALVGHFQFNSGGECSGWGSFEGEIVPQGRFDYEVTR